MEKQELLKNIQSSLERGIITRDDLIMMSDKAVPLGHKEAEGRDRFGISEILYYLGGLIVFIGIAIFVGQNWETLGDATKVLATLGAGISMYVAGVLLSQYKNLNRPAIGLHLIAALLIPGGIFVTLDVAGITVGLGLATLLLAVLAVFYLVSYIAYKKNLFLLLSIIFGTGLYFSFTDYLLEGTVLAWSDDFHLYRIGVLGLAYLLFGYSFSKQTAQDAIQEARRERKAPSLIALLNTAGVICFLGAALALGGFEPDKNMFWEIIFPMLALGTIFLSIEVKSRAYLILGALFLMGYIMKITAEYFSDSLGWPLSLVLVGFAFIGIGYLSFALNKKYLKKS